eukprot:363615_1
MLFLLQEQQKNLLKERAILLEQLELKYTGYINSLLQQKCLIASTIKKQYDEMTNKINGSILNYICDKIQPIEPIARQISNSTINQNDTNVHTDLPLWQPHINVQANENKSNMQSMQHSNINTPPTNISYINIPSDFVHLKKNKSISNIRALRIYIPKVNLTCMECNKLFDSYIDFENHMKINHSVSRAYKCTYSQCNKCYKGKKNLLDHIRIKHMNEKNYECNLCHKQFYAKNDVRRHIDVHSRQKMGIMNNISNAHANRQKHLVCSICGKQFLEIWDWKWHCEHWH